MLQYTLVRTDEGANITVFVPGEAPLVAHSDHPYFDEIVAGALIDDESIVDLFDVVKTNYVRRMTQQLRRKL